MQDTKHQISDEEPGCNGLCRWSVLWWRSRMDWHYCLCVEYSSGSRYFLRCHIFCSMLITAKDSKKASKWDFTFCSLWPEPIGSVTGNTCDLWSALEHIISFLATQCFHEQNLFPPTGYILVRNAVDYRVGHDGLFSYSSCCFLWQRLPAEQRKELELFQPQWFRWFQFCTRSLWGTSMTCTVFLLTKSA